MNLGIKKNVNAKKSKSIQKESIIKSDQQNILSETIQCKPYSKDGEDLSTMSDSTSVHFNQTKPVSDVSSNHNDPEMPSTTKSAMNLSESGSIIITDVGKNSNKSSLSCLSYDYGSSNSSSDNE